MLDPYAEGGWLVSHDLFFAVQNILVRGAGEAGWPVSGQLGNCCPLFIPLLWSSPTHAWATHQNVT